MAKGPLANFAAGLELATKHPFFYETGEMAFNQYAISGFELAEQWLGVEDEEIRKRALCSIARSQLESKLLDYLSPCRPKSHMPGFHPYLCSREEVWKARAFLNSFLRWATPYVSLYRETGDEKSEFYQLRVILQSRYRKSVKPIRGVSKSTIAANKGYFGDPVVLTEERTIAFGFSGSDSERVIVYPEPDAKEECPYELHDHPDGFHVAQDCSILLWFVRWTMDPLVKLKVLEPSVLTLAPYKEAGLLRERS